MLHEILYQVGLFCYVFSSMHFQESFIWRKLCFHVNPDVSFVRDGTFDCVRTWMDSCQLSPFAILVLIKLGGLKLFLPQDKPQLVCSVFGLNVLGFFVLFSHKYMIELQLSVMY